MTDEPQSEDVELPSEEGDDEEDSDEPVSREPETAVRNSPNAIAAMVVGALSVLPLAQGYFTSAAFYPDFGPVTTEMIVRVVAASLPTIALGAAAFWLADRGDEEIYAANGRFGGVAFCTAARVIAVISIVSTIGLTVLGLTVRTGPEAIEVGSPDDITIPEDEEFIPPSLPSGVDVIVETGPPPAAPQRSAGR